MTPAPTVHWVEDDRAVAELGKRLRDEPVVSLDTEQDSFFAYRTKVCLVQIGVPGEEWIVDPLAAPDLGPLREAFARPDTVTIVHAAENDLGLLRRDFGLRVHGLFDTMLAAAVLGRRRTGLAPLLDELFQVRLAKDMQRSDWRQRPLSREQIEYAALDVRYLPRLRDVLLAELRASGREEEAASEFQRLESFELAERAPDPDAYWRLEGARGLDPVARRCLRDLHRLREEIAAEEDRARFRVMGDGTLMALARAQPLAPADLRRTPGLPERVFKTHGLRILATVREALEAGPLPPPPRRPPDGPRRLDDDQRKVFDRLRAWRTRRAEQRGVEPGRVAPNAMLLELIDALPVDEAGLARHGFEPWRIREYGAELLAELRAIRAERESS